jgi:hypothetical protein
VPAPVPATQHTSGSGLASASAHESGLVPVPSVPAPVSAQSSSTQPPSSSTGSFQIEDLPLSLPSNGNISSMHNELECTHRISLAEHHLNQIRNLIAEKSFQFSHVIRVSPRKVVTTRSRAAIKKINLQIALHCRLYAKCRGRFVALNCDSETQSRLKILSPEDVKASTAIVNPNEPGSTRLKLSWIWGRAGGHRTGLSEAGNAGLNAGLNAGTTPELLECKSYLKIFSKYLHFLFK